MDEFVKSERAEATAAELISRLPQLNNFENKAAEDEFEGKTYIVPVGMSSDEKPYVVKETPEEIDDMILNGNIHWMHL